MEAAMSRISMIGFCLAALAFSAGAASAASVTVHTTTPIVKVPAPHPAKVQGASSVTIHTGNGKPIHKVWAGTRTGGTSATPYDDKQKGGKGHDEMFLKLDGIAGESKDDTHKSE
jgi:hypothetical protein